MVYNLKWLLTWFTNSSRCCDGLVECIQRAKRFALSLIGDPVLGGIHDYSRVASIDEFYKRICKFNITYCCDLSYALPCSMSKPPDSTEKANGTTHIKYG